MIHFHNIYACLFYKQKLSHYFRFVNGGFQHEDLFFIDGSTPPDHILTSFLDICEDTKGGVAGRLFFFAKGFGKSQKMDPFFIDKDPHLLPRYL